MGYFLCLGELLRCYEEGFGSEHQSEAHDASLGLDILWAEIDTLAAKQA